jgi:hypothetical protein
MATKFFQSPFDTPPFPHCLMATEFFFVAQKGMGGRREMTIKTRGGKKKKSGKKWKRGNKNEGKIWQD